MTPQEQPEEELSTCCNAPTVTIGIGDFNDKDRPVTMHWECKNCGHACDIRPAHPQEQSEKNIIAGINHQSSDTIGSTSAQEQLEDEKGLCRCGGANMSCTSCFGTGRTSDQAAWQMTSVPTHRTLPQAPHPQEVNRDAVEKRLFSHVKKTATCWVWTGVKARGYGMTSFKRTNMVAHRAVYELLVGRIPKGMTLDHLCRNRACVNPKHLEPVSFRENVLRGESIPAINARKTHCKHGHEFTEENTYRERQNKRQCRTCIRQRAKNRKRL